MREYSIQRAGTEPEWIQIPALSADIPLWGTKAEVSMLQKLCYDAEHLYVYQRAEEKIFVRNIPGLRILCAMTAAWSSFWRLCRETAGI